MSAVTLRSRPKRRMMKKSKAWYSKKYSIAQIASQALKGVKYLKGLVNVERKFHTITNAQNVGWDGTYRILLTGVSQGDTATTRDGNSILLKTLYVKGLITMDTTVSTTFLRFYLILDTQQCEGTSPSFTDIFESTLISSSSAPLANLNRQNAGRFKILYTKGYNLSAVSIRNQSFSIYKKFYKHHLTFNDAGTHDKGHIYAFAISDQSGAGNPPEIRATSRVTYYDN